MTFPVCSCDDLWDVYVNRKDFYRHQDELWHKLINGEGLHRNLYKNRTSRLYDRFVWQHLGNVINILSFIRCHFLHCSIEDAPLLCLLAASQIGRCNRLDLRWGMDESFPKFIVDMNVYPNLEKTFFIKLDCKFFFFFFILFFC